MGKYINKYTIIVYWNSEYQEYIARCIGVKEFENLIGEDEDKIKAIKELETAIELCIDIMKKEGKSIPIPQEINIEKLETVIS